MVCSVLLEVHVYLHVHCHMAYQPKISIFARGPLLQVFILFFQNRKEFGPNPAKKSNTIVYRQAKLKRYHYL